MFAAVNTELYNQVSGGCIYTDKDVISADKWIHRSKNLQHSKNTFPTVKYFLLEFILKWTPVPLSWLKCYLRQWEILRPCHIMADKGWQQGTNLAFSLPCHPSVAVSSHLPRIWNLPDKSHYSRTWLDREQSASPKGESVSSTCIHTALQSLTRTLRQGHGRPGWGIHQSHLAEVNLCLFRASCSLPIPLMCLC